MLFFTGIIVSSSLALTQFTVPVSIKTFSFVHAEFIQAFLYSLHAGQRFRPWLSNCRIGPLAICPSLSSIFVLVILSQYSTTRLDAASVWPRYVYLKSPWLLFLCKQAHLWVIKPLKAKWVGWKAERACLKRTDVDYYWQRNREETRSWHSNIRS